MRPNYELSPGSYTLADLDVLLHASGEYTFNLCDLASRPGSARAHPFVVLPDIGAGEGSVRVTLFCPVPLPVNHGVIIVGEGMEPFRDPVRSATGPRRFGRARSQVTDHTLRAGEPLHVVKGEGSTVEPVTIALRWSPVDRRWRREEAPAPEAPAPAASPSKAPPKRAAAAVAP